MDKNITFEGSLLIASKSMPDPRFSKSVILLINFSSDGAMGIVLNKPHKINLKDVLKDTVSYTHLTLPTNREV